MSFWVYLAVAATAIVAILLTLGVIKTLQAPARRASFDEGLSIISASELEIDTAMNRTEKPEKLGFFGYWYERSRQAGQKIDNPKNPGYLVLGLAFAAFGIGYLIVPGGVIGAVINPLAAIAAYWAFLGYQAGKRKSTMEKQLPLLLSGLRANLQAGATPQQALLSVADDLPAPLGDEVRALRDDLNVSVPLEEALADLSRRVPSREMQFLASSIEIAVRSGADLDPQLATIEEIVAQRTRIRQKLKAAIAQVTPTQMIAAGVIPLMFIVSLNGEENREFWFSAFGIIVLVVTGFLYAGGMIVIRLMVKNVENS